MQAPLEQTCPPGQSALVPHSLHVLTEVMLSLQSSGSHMPGRLPHLRLAQNDPKSEGAVLIIVIVTRVDA